MSLNLVSDVFEPVFRRLESEIGYLADKSPQLFGLHRGLESWFQQIIVTPTLKARGYQVTQDVGGKVDLRLRHANSEVLLELKAANDCWVPYMAGIEKGSGWLKYVEQGRQHFAGCLFLGCTPDQEKLIKKFDESLKNLKETRGHEIQLAQCCAVAASDPYHWVLGLLVTPYGRTLAASP